MNSEPLSRRALLIGVTALGAAESSYPALPGSSNRDPFNWTLLEASGALARRSISSEELTKLCLARIKKLQPTLNAFITLQEGSALAQAHDWDRQRAASGAAGPLYGVPIALKDNIDT